MMLPLIVRGEAEKDIAAARDWYDQQRQGLGEDFLDAVQERFDEIERAPQHYAASRRSVRMAQTRRYPYIIYYRLLDDRIDVVAVMHGHRGPRAWQKRL
jgi:plasmid stabilization system protein ParE